MTKMQLSSTREKGKGNVEESTEPPEISVSSRQHDQTLEDYAGHVSVVGDNWRVGSSGEEESSGRSGEEEKFLSIREGSSENRSSGSDDRMHDRWVDVLLNKMDSACQRNSPHGRAFCTIYQVPRNIRNHDAQAYQPRLVAIGPYHRAKPGLHVTDDDKWKCTRLLSHISPRLSQDELLRSWIKKIRANERRARSCYSRDAGMDSVSFVEMLLLDGCFIIYILLMTVQSDSSVKGRDRADGHTKKDDEESPLMSMLGQWKLLKLDLLLLENQIPFFIIQDLFNQIEDPGIRRISVAHLALKLFDELYPSKIRGSLFVNSNRVYHLLHIFHSALMPSANYRMTDTVCMDSIAQLQIPSATELGESAVQCRRKDSARSFLDITFCKGELEIPTLYIFDHSNALFRNLIAFEQCYPGVSPYITAYMTFMECIMHSKRDVRLLHLSGVVVNKLGTDKDVANFFKNICYLVDHSHVPHYLSPLCEEVVDHHRSQWCRWNAELKLRYFSNPWVALSVFAAVILLCLNFIQTLYTVLGYYHK